MKKTALLLLIALVLGWTGCSSDSTVEVKNLRLEMKENPLGINVAQPVSPGRSLPASRI